VSDAQDMHDAVVAGDAFNPDRNLILESEYLPRSIDLGARAVDRSVRVIVATRYCVLPVEEKGPLSLERELELRAWLGRREEIFRAWTLPSMRAQRHEPHMWVLLVDRRLMHIVGPRIADDLPPWAYIVPVDPERASSWTLDWFAAPHVEKHTAVVARLDNDDAVADDYCHALATWTRLAKPGPALLSFPHGLQSYAEPLLPPRMALSTTGHFSALVVPAGERLNNALGYMHTLVYRGGLDVPVRQLITTQPMWVEVLHDANLANHPRPGRLLGVDSGAMLYGRFGQYRRAR
jgi:hypothetical protein